MRLLTSAALAGLLVTGLVAVAAPASACVPSISLDPDRIGEPEYRPAVQQPEQC